MKRKRLTRSALGLSVVLIVLWLILGATSSIAWFQDEDTLVNHLHFGDLKVELSYKSHGEYKKVTQSTVLLADEALYEPGYTQIVYLKIVNKGTVPFSYKMAVTPTDIVFVKSVLGSDINLSDYIKFGLIIRDTEEEVMTETADRNAARENATEKVSNYFTEPGSLDPEEEAYAALIVHMPESVGNEANYRGDTPPSISLNFEAVADQLR